MKLFTIQLASWRKAQALSVPFYDVTVKSGDKLFAPSWGLLRAYKDKAVTEEEYTIRFLDEMRVSYKNNKQHWVDFLSQDSVAIACFCGKGGFCHRYILVDIFEKVCNNLRIEFNYEGEM